MPVAITDRDRKQLWGLAAAKCAICRHTLVEPAKAEEDRDALIGEEAHIVAQSPGGPRAGVPLNIDIDSYENLILLCRNHHRVVDEQTAKYTVEVLKTLKAKHEKWVHSRLHTVQTYSGPTRVVLEDPTRPVVLPKITTGKQAWNVVHKSHGYMLESPDEDEASAEACDRADIFLTSARDWGEVSAEVEDQGRTGIREAERSMRELLDELSSHNLVAFGAPVDMVLRGGGGPDSAWKTAVLVVRPKEAVGDIDSLIVIFGDLMDLPSFEPASPGEPEAEMG